MKRILLGLCAIGLIGLSACPAGEPADQVCIADEFCDSCKVEIETCTWDEDSDTGVQTNCACEPT